MIAHELIKQIRALMVDEISEDYIDACEDIIVLIELAEAEQWNVLRTDN